MVSRKHAKCGGHFELLKAASNHKIYQCDKCGEWVTLYAVDKTRGWATEVSIDEEEERRHGEEFDSDGVDY